MVCTVDAGPPHLQLQLVVLVVVFAGRGREGELVAALGLRHGALKQAGDVVAAVQHKAAALLGDDLQAELAEFDVACAARGVQEVLVEVRLADVLRGADGVDSVDDDLGATKLCCDCDDVG